MKEEVFDVAVIGAGAAGMMSAVRIGAFGLKTIVLEKKSRPGIKLSITGKGRCNITNSASLKEFVDCFHNGKFLYCSFNAFSNIDTISFFENLGVLFKLERGGRYFPVSDKAQDVVAALVKEVKKFSKILTSFDVTNIKKNDDLFTIFSANNSIKSKNLIIACGGASYPSTGSDGSGYAFAKSFGHTIKPPIPAIVPIVLDREYLKELQGLKLKNVEASVISDGKDFYKQFGEMEFTSFGVDGPIILMLSGLIAEKKSDKNLVLSLNLKSALSREKLNQRLLREIDKFGQYHISTMLKELLPVQMIRSFVNYCEINATKKCSQISKVEREKMLNGFLDFRFNIIKTKDLKEAIVTRGGIVTDEINQKTMESKLIKGLYFCGEVIDVDAPTGGFNLQAAFSTGYLAGSSIGEMVK
jgi:predicted Rossmann fold flavoprotein